MSLKNCTEALVLTQPRLIEDIHRAYLDAGADIIETCTFNANPIGMGEFRLEEVADGTLLTVIMTLAGLYRRLGQRLAPANVMIAAGAAGPEERSDCGNGLRQGRLRLRRLAQGNSQLGHRIGGRALSRLLSLGRALRETPEASICPASISGTPPLASTLVMVILYIPGGRPGSLPAVGAP